MIFENISAKQFTFIGLAMVGVSIIIPIAFMFDDPADREAFLRHEKCLDDYSTILFGRINNTSVSESENMTINTICGNLHPDPDIEDAITNQIMTSIAAFLLVIGVIMSLSGTAHWLVSKFKKKR